MDWKTELATPIYTDVLSELGTDITVEVVQGSTRTPSGKKVPSSVTAYTGKAVKCGYVSKSEIDDIPVINAGDVKFAAQFKDETFTPSEKLNETIIFGGTKYKIAYVKSADPDASVVIVWLLYARRVN